MKVIKEALAEDKAHADATTQSFIRASQTAKARLLAKGEGLVCGLGVARAVFRAFDPHVVFTAKKKDGQSVYPGEEVALLRGKARSLLSCERVALNFLSHLSGIATATAEAVRRVRGKKIAVLDTRKTIPRLRPLQKYAVLAGGGKNHRFDLSRQYLVKDNHLVLLRSSGDMQRLRRRRREWPFEIEVDDIRELKAALAFAPDILMLDNFTPGQSKKALRYLRGVFPLGKDRPKIELSGGITLKNISRYAIRGVDFISLGSLTHSVTAFDFSLEITGTIKHKT